MNNTSRAAEIRRGTAQRPRLDLTIQYGAGVSRLAEHRRLKRWADAAVVLDVQVTLRLVDEAEGRWLNHRYRQRNYATNVLTFAYPETMPLAGDIVICLPVVAREAREQSKQFEAHLAHLVVHGLLHLQGFDHERGSDAELMEGIETEILDKLGYADPYNVG
jgi:probable rRNA maturation factor